MRTIKHLLKKEFLQIFRNKFMIPLIFFMPLIQLIILANAATFEIRNINFSVVDLDNSSYSRELISKFSRNGYFILKDFSFSSDEALEGFKRNETKLILNIPRNFEKDYRVSGKTKIQLLINAEDMSAAGIIYNYAGSIIQNFNRDIIIDFVNYGEQKPVPVINVSFSNWYNPELNYKTFMVPGILVILVTMIGTFLTGMNIAREKEIGTIEQLNVTPIKKYQFIIGKLFPFWLIGIAELFFGMILGLLLYNIPLLGSPFLILLLAAVYLIVVLGIGLLISTVTNTQQQAMFIAWFIMVLFILLGGIFTPVEYMPQWAKVIAFFNPIAHFNKAMRMIMLKGSGLKDVIQTLYILIIYAVVILSLAVWRYRKVE
ncbi:MAG: ABC transporter permease [Ignavibacteria bacterium]|nr:ABC transporter permease [Ignavibacteria bacterium]